MHAVKRALARQAAVALIGPRQVGKTTLAFAIGEETPALYLDLEAREDRAKPSDPALFLSAYADRLVILDEIHRAPELFQTLRGLIDEGRRRGRRGPTWRRSAFKGSRGNWRGHRMRGATMTSLLTMTPIGHVRGGRAEALDDDWGAERARIELDGGAFGPDALAGLAAFSHIEVIFVFDRVADDEIERGARRPRGRADWPMVGIFAQRGRNRPNRLGVCTCRLIGVGDLSVEVEGLDAIDGTPVLDIKPVLSGFLPRGQVVEPAWATEIMKDYW